ncbi:MAG: tetratricopeptide repeat protein [Deltaproteobacteria bacterium]|nr:tetratricopeptide repeat protein [Deltaproteobacteria bacterium]
MFHSSSFSSSKFFQLTATLALVQAFGVIEVRGQEPEFSSTTQVTAVDVLLDTSSKKAKKKRQGLQSGSLEPRDFQVFLGGLGRPVISLEEPNRETTPWNLLLYFEAGLHSQQEMAWAAGLLSEHAAALTDLGVVSILVADPSPRILLEKSQDLEEIQEVLARLRFDPRGEDTLGQLRRTLLQAPDSDLSELSGDGAALLSLETRLLRDRLDVLLLQLAKSSPNPRRALFWIGGGFDLEPETYYLEDGSSPGATIRPWAEEFATTLAAYGWISLSLIRPLPENRAGIKPGRRIGKFRILPPFIPPLVVIATYEEDRDREKAEAYFQQGLSHARGGNDLEAVESFEKSLFHFYGDPRTSQQQSEALVELGRAYERLGEEQKAQRAFEAARELTQGEIPSETPLEMLPEGQEVASREADPETPRPGSLTAEARRPAGLADIDAEPAAHLIADITAGRVIQDGEALGRELVELGRRLLLTYQLDGPPGGAVQPLEARIADGAETLPSPAFGRSGSLESVTEARVRQFILQGGWLEAPDSPETRLYLVPDSPPSAPPSLEIVPSGKAASEPSPPNAELEVDLRRWQTSSSALRLTLARTELEGATTFEHRLVGPGERRDGSYRWPIYLDRASPDDSDPAAIYREEGEELWVLAIEDLSSGERRIGTLEPHQLLPPPG